MKTTHPAIATLPIYAAALFAVPADVVLRECRSHEAMLGWRELLNRHPHDEDLRSLHHLRIRLCNEIALGETSLVDASAQFERARERLMDRWASAEDNTTRNHAMA